MERLAFDQQLFSCQDVRQQFGGMEFRQVKLNVAVGQFPAGTEFPSAVILGHHSLLILVDEQDKEYVFDLKLTAGEAVDLSEDCDEDCDCECHDHEHLN
jgi:hypothetical protein